MEAGKQVWDLSRGGAVESPPRVLPEGKLRQWSDQGPGRRRGRTQKACPCPRVMLRCQRCRKGSHRQPTGLAGNMCCHALTGSLLC